MEAVKSGTSLKAAARSFGIPPKTLRRHRDMKVATPGKSKLGSKSTVFTPEYEALLVEHIKQMEKVFFGLTTIDICRLAFELAVQLKISHPFQNASAGLDWLKGFLKRHPSLTIRTPKLRVSAELLVSIGHKFPSFMRYTKKSWIAHMLMH